MIVEISLVAQCKPLYFTVFRAIFSADANANWISERKFELFRTACTALLSYAALGFSEPISGEIAFLSLRGNSKDHFKPDF
jgi:hypothetical protein